MKPVINPAISEPVKGAGLTWIYRFLALALTLFLAVSISLKENRSDGSSANLSILKAFGFMLIPGGFLYLVFSYWLLTNGGGGMIEPGILVVAGGILFLGVYGAFYILADSAATAGTALARAINAKPRDAGVIVPAAVFTALLFGPVALIFVLFRLIPILKSNNMDWQKKAKPPLFAR